MRGRDTRLEEIKRPRSLPPTLLSFFQSSVFWDSQENMAVGLVSETQEGHEVECDHINSDSDCACE